MKEYISDSIISSSPEKHTFCGTIDFEVLKNLILTGLEVHNLIPPVILFWEDYGERWFSVPGTGSGRGSGSGEPHLKKGGVSSGRGWYRGGERSGQGMGSHSTVGRFQRVFISVKDGGGSHFLGNGEGSGWKWSERF